MQSTKSLILRTILSTLYSLELYYYGNKYIAEPFEQLA